MASAAELHDVLLVAHRFLDLRDIANILSTSRKLRYSDRLALRVLKCIEHCRHFFQNCSHDWFDLEPRFLIEDGHWQQCSAILPVDEGSQGSDEEMMEASSSQSDATLYESKTAAAKSEHCGRHSPRKMEDEMKGVPIWRAHLVKTVGLVERMLLRWCYQPVVVGDEVHVMRPVLIALGDREVVGASDFGADGAACGHMWRASDVSDRLNAAKIGAGAKLVAGDPYRTSFGVHWDNIHVDDSPVVCACCNSLEPTVHEYRATVSLMYRRWLTTATSSQDQWIRQGHSTQEIEEMVDLLREELLPRDGFFNEAMAMASDNVLMAYICAHSDMSHAFETCPVSPTDAQRCCWKTVFHTTMRSMCREIIVPLKIAVTQLLMYTTCASARWEWIEIEESTDDDDMTKACWSDVVAGVFPTGFVVGFYYMTYRNNAAQPTETR